MAGKKYYFLKLPEDFFRSLEIKKLRRIAGGDSFTIIYLKMMLLSLQNDGMVFYQGIEDSFAKELALLLDEDYDNVSFTLQFLLHNGLLEEKSSIEALLTAVPEMISKDTDDAKRMRESRRRKKLAEEGKLLESLENGESEQCSDNVQECSRKFCDDSNNIQGLLSDISEVIESKEIGAPQDLKKSLENGESEQCSDNVQECSKKFTDIDIDIELEREIESISQNNNIVIYTMGPRKNIRMTEGEIKSLKEDYGAEFQNLIAEASNRIYARTSGEPINNFYAYIRSVAKSLDLKTTQQEERTKNEIEKKRRVQMRKTIADLISQGYPFEEDYEQYFSKEEVIALQRKAITNKLKQGFPMREEYKKYFTEEELRVLEESS